jgi:phosphotransferase system  glucose/maltose/N-acetylglucosamine-specific IIC component
MRSYWWVAVAALYALVYTYVIALYYVRRNRMTPEERRTADESLGGWSNT